MIWVQLYDILTRQNRRDVWKSSLRGRLSRWSVAPWWNCLVCFCREHVTLTLLQIHAALQQQERMLIYSNLKIAQEVEGHQCGRQKGAKYSNCITPVWATPWQAIEDKWGSQCFQTQGGAQTTPPTLKKAQAQCDVPEALSSKWKVSVWHHWPCAMRLNNHVCAYEMCMPGSQVSHHGTGGRGGGPEGHGPGLESSVWAHV